MTSHADTPQASAKAAGVTIRFTRQIFYADPAVYQAEVRESPLLLRSGPFHSEIEAELRTFRALFASRISADYQYWESPTDSDPAQEVDARDLAVLGTQLYQLLPAALREGLPALFQHAFDRGQGVRLCLEATAGDRADQLLSLPWEIMRMPNLQLYLGQMPRVTITRRLLETVRRTGPLLAPPFRIAHLIADTALPQPIAPTLQAAEREAIRQAAGAADFYRLVARPGSVERLEQELARQPYAIVHFLGHGDVDTQFSQQSYLRFEGADGSAQLVTSEQLARILSGSPSTQLLVLNACHGASVEAANTLAMQLVYNGIPYVVAMQGEVSEAAAGVFAQTFYARLQNHGRIDEAVAEGRHKIAVQLPGAVDWCLPALYVSAGITAAPVAVRAINMIEHRLSQPAGRRQIGNASIGLGIAHLAVASLLLVSGAAPPPLAPALLTTLVGAMLLLPPLIALAARLSGQVAIPDGTSHRLPAQTTLLLRIFAATAIGLGLTAVYAWSALLLMVGMGFWAILTLPAQVALLAMLFLPGLLVGWQQALGHARGLSSNNVIVQQELDWREVSVVVAGYLMLCGPLLPLWIMPQLLAPPLGNFAVGVLLSALGYQIRKL